MSAHGRRCLRLVCMPVTVGAAQHCIAQCANNVQKRANFGFAFLNNQVAERSGTFNQEVALFVLDPAVSVVSAVLLFLVQQQSMTAMVILRKIECQFERHPEPQGELICGTPSRIWSCPSHEGLVMRCMKNAQKLGQG